MMRRVFEFLRGAKKTEPGRPAAATPSVVEPARDAAAASYEASLAQTIDFYNNTDFNKYSGIFDYWGSTYIQPMRREIGAANSMEFFAVALRDSARNCGATFPHFCSVGAGDCSNEIAIASFLIELGLEDFTIECLELNGDLLERGRQAAVAAGLEKHFTYVVTDLNAWTTEAKYHGIMVHHALHHVVNLEGLLDAIKGSLLPGAYFVVADMIGRNGHMRWPEALAHLQRFWQELPPNYRYNRLLSRQEDVYENYDCSPVAFEGIRAQDILPLLIERFSFHKFLAFGNVVDVFVDACFGPNFNVENEWDRKFIDRVHAFDEQAFLSGELTPTQMNAVLAVEPATEPYYVRGLSPERSVRHPDRD